MKKGLLMVISAIGAMLLTGCAVGGPALVYTNTTQPLVATTTALSNSGNISEASKRGEASCHNVLGIVAFGDCSVSEAAKQGGISQVKSADVKTTNILYLYNKTTVILKGQWLACDEQGDLTP